MYYISGEQLVYSLTMGHYVARTTLRINVWERQLPLSTGFSYNYELVEWIWVLELTLIYF